MAKAYWEDRLAGGPTLANVGYSGLGLAYNVWLYRIRGRVFRRTVRRLNLDVATTEILDIGSGSGFYIDQWRRVGASRLSGSDLTAAAVRSLRTRYSDVPFTQFDVGAPMGECPPRKLDIVPAMDVLFHITDDQAYEQALVNVSRLLRPGGLFLSSDNFVHGPTIRAKHQVSRPLAGIVASLNAAGFRVVTRVPMFVLMNFPIDTRHQAAQLLWRLFSRVPARHEFLGHTAGAMLLPIETSSSDFFQKDRALN